jgi:hypothetical protein
LPGPTAPTDASTNCEAALLKLNLALLFTLQDVMHQLYRPLATAAIAMPSASSCAAMTASTTINAIGSLGADTWRNSMVIGETD